MPKLLLIDDETEFCETISGALDASGLTIQTCQNGKEAVELYRKERADVVFCDMKIPGLNGLAVLEAIKAIDPWATVIMVTAHGSVDVATHALRLGAYDFYEKPLTLSKLQQATRRALEHRRNLKEVSLLQGKPGSPADIPARLAELEEMKADFLEIVIQEIGKAQKLLVDEVNLAESGFYGKEVAKQEAFLNQLCRSCKIMDRLVQSGVALLLSYGKPTSKQNDEKTNST